MKYSDGKTYEGEWKDDKKSGKGIMKYSDGDTYEGEWKDDQKSGKGIMTYADPEGIKYEGEWKDDNVNIKSDEDCVNLKDPLLYDVIKEGEGIFIAKDKKCYNINALDQHIKVQIKKNNNYNRRSEIETPNRNIFTKEELEKIENYMKEKRKNNNLSPQIRTTRQRWNTLRNSLRFITNMRNSVRSLTRNRRTNQRVVPNPPPSHSHTPSH